MRQDVVGDHHVGLAGRQLVGQFEGEELRDRRNAGLARLLRGTGGGVYAEAGDGLLDDVTQAVAVIARDLDHQAVAAEAPRTDARTEERWAGRGWCRTWKFRGAP